MSKEFNGKAIILSAPSGAGKTTIVKNLLKTKMPLSFSISACSRPKRNNEINGKDYHFLSIEEFKTKINDNSFINLLSKLLMERLVPLKTGLKSERLNIISSSKPVVLNS